MVVATGAAAVACSTDCVDAGPLPPPMLTPSASVPSVLVVGAAPGALWWVPLSFADARLLVGDESVTPDVVVTTSTSVALRVPAEFDVGAEARLVNDSDESLGVVVILNAGEPHAVEPARLAVNATTATRPVASSFCPEGPFDRQPPAAALPALQADFTTRSPDLGSVAVDLFAGADTDDTDNAPRIADTAALRSFDAFDTRIATSEEATSLHISAAPGRYRLRVRSLFDGSVGDVADVEVVAP